MRGVLIIAILLAVAGCALLRKALKQSPDDDTDSFGLDNHFPVRAGLIPLPRHDARTVPGPGAARLPGPLYSGDLAHG